MSSSSNSNDYLFHPVVMFCVSKNIEHCDVSDRIDGKCSGCANGSSKSYNHIGCPLTPTFQYPVPLNWNLLMASVKKLCKEKRIHLPNEEQVVDTILMYLTEKIGEIRFLIQTGGGDAFPSSWSKCVCKIYSCPVSK